MKSHIWNLESRISNLKFEVAKDYIWNLKSEIRNLNSEIWNTWNLKCEIWNLKYGIRNRKPQIGSLKYEISNLESGIQNRKSEIWSCQRPCCKKGFNAARLDFSELMWQWWPNRAVLNNLTCEKYETWQESQNSDQELRSTVNICWWTSVKKQTLLFNPPCQCIAHPPNLYT